MVSVVSDSTSEVLVAENLMNSSLPEDEILTGINSKQLQKPNLSQTSTICALSAEEQKILQSLHHLDERLYCKYAKAAPRGEAEICLLYLYLYFIIKSP